MYQPVYNDTYIAWVHFRGDSKYFLARDNSFEDLETPHRPTMDRAYWGSDGFGGEPRIGVDPPNYAELSDLRTRGMILLLDSSV